MNTTNSGFQVCLFKDVLLDCFLLMVLFSPRRVPSKAAQGGEIGTTEMCFWLCLLRSGKLKRWCDVTSHLMCNQYWFSLFRENLLYVQEQWGIAFGVWADT